MKMNFLLFLLVPILSLQASLQDVPQLTLSASATIVKPADELQLKIGIITLAATAQEALEENSYKMHHIIDHLKALGLTKDDYETNQFSINPTYTPYPKDPPPFWKPSINGYEVTNTLLIHTSKLDRAGQIIDEASQAGANSITDIQFGLHPSRDYWTEVLTAAGANAIQDAKTLAEATGVTLVRILSLSLHNKQMSAPEFNVAKFKAPGAVPPLEPGDVSLKATVTVVYEVQ